MKLKLQGCCLLDYCSKLNICAFNHFKFFFNFLGGRCCDQTNHHNHNTGNDEGGKQFIHREDATQLADKMLPNDDHNTAGQHTRDGARKVGALSEKGEKNQRTKCSAKPCPSVRNNTENRVVAGEGN